MKPTIVDIKLSDVVFDEVIYPRKDHDPALVQRYADVLDEIEAQQKFISISSDNKLLDGKHRWLGYRKKHGDNTKHVIKAYQYNVATPHEQLKLAAQLNSNHGWQLSDDDKKMTAITLYSYGCTYDDIASTLSIGKKKVGDWLSHTVKKEKEKRSEKVFDMWMACATQQEIASETGIDQGDLSKLSQGFMETVLKNQNHKTSAEYAIDFDPPLYPSWSFHKKSNVVSHFGNSEVGIVDNLLYLYTQPFDVVIDPFAGGGSTIDICKKRFRRYFVSDRKPIVEREKEIRAHDLTEGLPKPPQWKDVKLVYLDPPYWKQAEGKYSKDKTDLANMPLEDFNKTLAEIINGFAKKLASGARIALLIQPTQWNAPNRQVVDHIKDMLCLVKVPYERRIWCPYSTEQCTPQMVNWAKENKDMLVINRELIIWKVS